MVDIPVDYEDSLPPGCEMGRSDSDAVQQAEAHPPIALGMVTRWPRQDEPHVGAGRAQRCNGTDPSPRSAPGRLEGIVLQKGVRVDPAFGTRGKSFQIPSLMHTQKVFESSGFRGHHAEVITQVEISQAGKGGHDPVRTFDVAFHEVLALAHRAHDDQHLTDGCGSAVDRDHRSRHV